MIPGAFVRVRFPTREKPRQPGLLHIGYIIGGTATETLVAYTTSQPWPSDVPLPAGARLFDADEARRLNQSKAFVTRLDILAKLPLAKAWFPDIDRPGQGIVAIAPADLQAELLQVAANLARRRRELLQMRGPLAQHPAGC
jgi:hypothetical protein